MKRGALLKRSRMAKGRERCVQCGAFSTGPCPGNCDYLARKRKPKTCIECGASYIRQLGRQGLAQKYCSVGCALTVKRRREAVIPATCAKCGAQFQRNRVMLRRSKRVFCSAECASMANRGEGNTAYRGPYDPNRGMEWRRLSAAMRDRDGHVCKRCGKPESENKGRKLAVDHIIPWRVFDDKAAANHPSNLISLCTACHNHKTHYAEQRWLKGDVQAFEQYLRAITMESQAL